MILKKEVLKLGKKYLSEMNDAEEFLKVAESNFNTSLKTSANRMYFALERAVAAFLHFKDKKVPKSRQKLWMIASELLGENCYQILRQLYDFRLQADYGSISKIVSLDSVVLKEFLAKTKEVVFYIKKSILTEGNNKDSFEKGEDTKKVL